MSGLCYLFRVRRPGRSQQTRADKAKRDNDDGACQQRRYLAGIQNAKPVRDRSYGLAHEEEKRVQRQRAGAGFHRELAGKHLQRGTADIAVEATTSACEPKAETVATG
jgi:hypothetical protein